MKFLIPFIALFLVACSHYPTPLPNGKGGVAHLTQIAGKGMVTYNADGSMAFTFDNEISWQHTMQTIAAAALSWSQASISKAKEVTTQFQAGQLTKQQAQAQMAAIQQAEIAAKSGAYSEALGAGAEASVGTVLPP